MCFNTDDGFIVWGESGPKEDKILIVKKDEFYRVLGFTLGS